MLEIAEEVIPAERMPDNDMCYPRFAQSMRYKLTPDDPAVSLEDDSPAERIYKKESGRFPKRSEWGDFIFSYGKIETREAEPSDNRKSALCPGYGDRVDSGI